MIECIPHGSAGAFLARAEGWLMRAEDRHNLMLGLAYGAPTDAFFATVERDGQVEGCSMRTPPHKVLVTDLPPAGAAVLAELLAATYEHVPAVLGPVQAAERVASAWVELRGGLWAHGMKQRIYRIDRVIQPRGVPGELRAARREELDLAAVWGEGFARDARVPFATRETVSGWIADGALHIWEVDGVPTSIAVAQGRTLHGARVGYVYTPPRHRRRGFAGACVAALSQKLLDEGVHFCVLYTDLSNASSNALYQRVGYRPIEDVGDVALSASRSS